MSFSFAKKYNNSSKFTFDTKDITEYKSLQDLYSTYEVDEIFKLHAVYINTKSKFGNSPVVAIDNCFVNFPKHMLDWANEVLNCEEAIEAINENKVGFKVETYVDRKHGRTCYAPVFVDL